MNEFSVLGAMAVGYVWQWARAPKNLPIWLANLIFVVVALGAYWLAVKQLPSIHTLEDFRQFAIGALMWVASCLGFGSLSADAKASPRTNAI